MSFHKSPLYLHQESIQSKLSKSDLEYKAQKAQLGEAPLFVLETVKKHYIAAANSRTYLLSSFSLRCDYTVLSDLVKLVKKVKSKIKAHLCDSKDPLSTMSFSATFKLAYDTNKIYKEAAVWFLRLFIKETLSNALNSCMCAHDRLAPLNASVCSEKLCSTNSCDHTKKWSATA